MSLRPRFFSAVISLLLTATVPVWAAVLPCRDALVPLSLVQAQRQRSPAPMIERFLEGLSVDFSQEKPFANSKMLYFTPVTSPVLGFMDARPDLGFVIRGDLEGQRVPLLFMTGKSRSIGSRENFGNVIDLTAEYDNEHPMRDLGSAVYNVLREGQYKSAAGISVSGLPFVRVSEGSFHDRLAPRFDIAWHVNTVDEAGTVSHTESTVWQFPSVFFMPQRDYSSELLGQVIPRTKPTDRVLVLGTGTGIDVLRLVTQADVQGPIEAVDINPMAVANTRFNADYWDIGGRVHAHVSDGFDAVEGGPFDVILFDAPLATEFTQFPKGHREEDINISLNDFEGRLLRRLLAGLPARLAPGGSFYLMSAEDISSVIAEFPALKSHRVHRFIDGIGKYSHPFGIHRIQVRQSPTRR